MATVQAATIVATTVDRETRDVLKNRLRSEACRLEDFERVIMGQDRRAAHEALALAVRLVEMFDQPAWVDDDLRDHYEITGPPDSCDSWLPEHGGDLAESLAGETMLLPGIEADDEGLYCGCAAAW